MNNLSAAKIRGELADVINRVAYNKERVAITRRGKVEAIIIPVEDFELLEALEEKMDLNDAKAARKVKGTKPWSKLKEELDL
jgi:prevent-host-death family protein